MFGKFVRIATAVPTYGGSLAVGWVANAAAAAVVVNPRLAGFFYNFSVMSSSPC